MGELRTLSDIFEKSLFRIPDYQRGYAWIKEQLCDFWDDIINLQNGRYHYTGLLSMKLLDENTRQKLGYEDSALLDIGYKAYHIVDGQQRLTTFIILLNEILCFVCNLSEKSLGGEYIQSIREKYICRKSSPESLITTYLFGYENDNPSSEYLKHCILGQPHGGAIKETYYTKNLKYAKSYFAAQLDFHYKKHGIEGIVDLYNKLTKSLMFNIHYIEDDYDVFVAFETMNNRGKRLTNLELLKNRLIYLTTLYSNDVLDKTNEFALRALINRTWSEVYHQLGRNESMLLSDDEFLRAHWIMYFTYSRRRGDDYIQFLLNKFSHKAIFRNTLSSSLINKIADDNTQNPEDIVDKEGITASEALDLDINKKPLFPKEIMDYVNSLKDTAESWYYTFNPYECKMLSEEEQVWLEKLNHVGIGYFRPLVAVSLIPSLRITKEERLEFFKAVERFIFIHFRMAGYQSSYKSSEYYRKAKEVYRDGDSIRDLTIGLNALSDGIAEDAIKEFVIKMNHRFINADGFYSWRDLRYFLYEYEYSLAKKFKVEKLFWAVLTNVVKDKITVEHILPQTPTKLYWRNQFRQFNNEEIKLLSASLGNMLPLSNSINSSLQNDSFKAKKARGYADGCHCQVEISKFDEWNADCIYDRGIKLLEFMESRWGIKFESDEQKSELLHIGFVKDCRVVPPEITNEVISPISSEDKRNEGRVKELATLILSWASVKDDDGDIHLDLDNCTGKFCRFTTDTMTKMLPDASEAASGWKTRNHYFYEIVNSAGKTIHMQLALSSENIPEKQMQICEKINTYFPSRKQKQDWVWRWPYVTAREKISDDMSSEEIVNVLNTQYAQLRDFEKRLVAAMEGNSIPD